MDNDRVEQVWLMGEVFELIASAKINFRNAEKAMPIMASHPFFKIAMAQLDEAEQKLEAING